MDKKTIKHIAAFITEDPDEFNRHWDTMWDALGDAADRPVEQGRARQYSLPDSGMVSSCCAAEIIDVDICSDCREHCDPLDGEEMPDEYRPDQPFEPVPARFDRLGRTRNASGVNKDH